MKLVEKLKSHSSKWIKTKGKSYMDFYWQRGYGGFSVNPSQIEILKTYIKKQAEHHQRKDFQKEYIQFLQKYQMDYDEKYIWD